MKVNESYNVGKQKLQIPEFLCKFFDICDSDKSFKEIKSLERN